jgi:hypothetical protein
MHRCRCLSRWTGRHDRVRRPRGRPHGARGGGHAGASEPAGRVALPAAASGAAGLGGRNNAWIIEDDYDGEYRYVSRPLPALKSLDRDGRVLYAGTFSKVLLPSLRLAYLVVPERRSSGSRRSARPSPAAVPSSPRPSSRLHRRRAFRAPHPADAQALRRASDLTAAGLQSVLGAHADRRPAGRHASDPAAAGWTLRSRASSRACGRRACTAKR